MQKSWIHSMAEVGRGLWRPSGQPQLQQGARPTSKCLLKVSREGTPQPLGNPCQLRHSPSTQLLPGVQAEPPVFGLCPLPLILALGTADKSLALSYLYLPLRCLQSELLRAEQSQLPQPLLTGKIKNIEYICIDSDTPLLHKTHW